MIFICSVCNREFANKTKYTYHKNSHYCIKPFKCEICGRQYAQKSHLKRHVALHETRRVDGENGQSSTEILQKCHKRPHTPVKCEVCGRVLYDRQALLRHIKKHTAAQKCPFCEEAINPYWLPQHVLQHHKPEIKKASPSVQKQFNYCALCRLFFRYPSLYLQHAKEHKEQ